MGCPAAIAVPAEQPPDRRCRSRRGRAIVLQAACPPVGRIGPDSAQASPRSSPTPGAASRC